jgi:hypothetical protein
LIQQKHAQSAETGLQNIFQQNMVLLWYLG